jgi:hypothetical protein
MRKWLKELIREVIREEIVSKPLILSSRPPTENDVYEVGAIWMDGNTRYSLVKVIGSWVMRQEKENNGNAI